MNRRISQGLGWGVMVCAVVMGATAHGAATNGDEIAFRSIGGTSYVIHSYTSVGNTFTFTPPNTLHVEYLVIGGGGGGAEIGNRGGGGGAGGVRKYVSGEGVTNTEAQALELTKEAHAVVVGAGGAIAPNTSSRGFNGSPSSLPGIEAIGGGGGGARGGELTTGADGGAGGGGSGPSSSSDPMPWGGSGTQGYGGGAGTPNGTSLSAGRGGGGGGGAGGEGGDAEVGVKGGDGGDGIISSITGDAIAYAGGGAGEGSTGYGMTHGLPGLGGTAVLTDGAQNTGAGGGSRGVGGSGIVVVRYALNAVDDWAGGTGHYVVSGNVGRLLVEDAVNLLVPEDESLTIPGGGRISIGAGASLTLEENASLTVSSGAALGGDGVIYGGLTLSTGAEFIFAPYETLTINDGIVDLGDLSVGRLVGLSSETPVGTYTLIDGSATLLKSMMQNQGEDFAYDLGGGRSAYFDTGSLQLLVIPEPHTLGLLLVAGALLALRRRKRGM